MKIRRGLLFGFVGLGLGVGLHFAFADPNVPTGGGSGGGGGGGGSVTQGTVPWVDDITQWANTVLGAATAWGTAPSGNVPGVNANVLALPALAAGTNSIGAVTVTSGNVGGFISSQSVTPTVSTTAYVAGYEMGGLQTYASLIRSGQTTGLIQKVALQFNDSQTASTDAIFFNANPTNTTFTDHAALAIAAADVTKVIGVAHVNDCSSLGTPSLCQAQNLAIPITASGSIYVVLVTRGTPTLASTSDLTVLISMVQN